MRQRGFTLLELLIATALAAGVTAAAVLVGRTVMDSDHRLQQRWERRTGLRDVHRLLNHYWTRQSVGTLSIHEGSAIYTVGEREQAYRVAFRCEPDGETLALALYRVKPNAERRQGMAEQDWPVEAREVLLTNLAVCTFSYLEPPGKDAPPRWVAQWRNPKSVPKMIRLDLSGPTGAVPPFIFSTEAL